MASAAAPDEHAETKSLSPTTGGSETAHEEDAQAVDKHPDGTPMTQDEIDTHWLRHVYKPHIPQLTPRAVVTGMLLGGVMSLSNLYVGLKTGWGLAVTVTAAVLAFGIFSGLKRVLPFGPFQRDFTSLENNTMASAASAAGYFTGAGLTSAVPALFLSQGITIVWWQLALWILAVSFLGVMIAVPMRRQMIDIDRLPFPEGMAYAETIRSLHAAPGEARKKALALLYGASASGLMVLLSTVLGFKNGPKLKEPLVPDQLGPAKWMALTLSLKTDILFIGAGAMMGVRISFGLLMGAILGWGVIPMWLHTHGLAGPAPVRGTVLGWIVWPGVTIIVVNGLLAFGLKWRTAFAALSGLGRLVRGTADAANAGPYREAQADDRPKTMAEVEVPSKWFIRGTLACIAFVVVLAKAFFDIPVWMGLLAAVLSVILSIVACRATGETSLTPVGPLGKITQFMYGGLAAGNVQTNLMTASITAGAAMHSADLLTDMKGGYLLGSKPRSQFLSQFFGIIAGAIFCIPAYSLLATPDKLGSANFPAPAAQTWRAVADLLASGIHQEVRGESDGVSATAPGVTLNILPVGTKAGDELDVTTAAEPLGKLKVVNVNAAEKLIELDRPLPPPSQDSEGKPLPFIGRLDSQALEGTPELWTVAGGGGAKVIVPATTKPGSEIEITKAPGNVGKLKVVDVLAREKVLLLDRALPPAVKDKDGHAAPFVVSLRGQALQGKAKSLLAVELTTPPEVIKAGDYLKADVNGRDLWWTIKGRAGSRVIVDRDFVDPSVLETKVTTEKDPETGADRKVETQEPKRIEGPLHFQIRKESLPPYALLAVLLAAVIAIVLTLLETYVPKKYRKWVPSAAGIGLGFVVSGFDCISMFIGSVIAWFIERQNKEIADKYTLATASGIMAGASLMGVLLILLAQVLNFVEIAQ